MQSDELEAIQDFCISRMEDNSCAALIAGNYISSPILPSSSSALDSSLDLTSISDQTNIDYTCEASPTNENKDSFFFSNLLQKTASPTIEKPEEELQRYCREVVPMTESFSLMDWWKTNQQKYPNLSFLALQIHSMPASSAAAERSFSLAGNISIILVRLIYIYSYIHFN